MEKYIAIEKYIRSARIERNVYVAEMTANMIVAAWKGIKYAADVLLSVSRAKTRNNVFTFDS